MVSPGRCRVCNGTGEVEAPGQDVEPGGAPVTETCHRCFGLGEISIFEMAVRRYQRIVAQVMRRSLPSDVRQVQLRRFEWEEAPNGRSWTYEAEDLCACVWEELGLLYWDVSGPGGRWTKASGSVRLIDFISRPRAIRHAQRQAELWLSGYRRGWEKATDPGLLPRLEKEREQNESQ